MTKPTIQTVNPDQFDREQNSEARNVFEPDPTEFPPTTKGFFSDLEALMESSEGEDISGVSSQEVLVRVPVRRPKKDEFIRVHPDPKMQLAATVYADRDEDEVYYVPKHM